MSEPGSYLRAVAPAGGEQDGALAPEGGARSPRTA